MAGRRPRDKAIPTELSKNRFVGKVIEARLDTGLKIQGGSAPLSGVTQAVLCPFPEGEQEQSEDDCLEADCSAPFIHYEP